MAEHTTVCMKKYILVCCFFVETTCPTNSVTVSCTQNILPWQTLALEKDLLHMSTSMLGYLTPQCLGDFSNTRKNHPKNPTKMHPSSWVGKEKIMIRTTLERNPAPNHWLFDVAVVPLFAGILFYTRFAQVRCCTTHWRWGGVWT